MKSKSYSGWFKALGDSGQTVQDIMTSVFTILCIGVLVLTVFLVVRAGFKIQRAEAGEERQQAIMKLVWIAIGGLIPFVAFLVPTILWNTIGKFSVADIGS